MTMTLTRRWHHLLIFPSILYSDQLISKLGLMYLCLSFFDGSFQLVLMLGRKNQNIYLGLKFHYNCIIFLWMYKYRWNIFFSIIFNIFFNFYIPLASISIYRYISILFVIFFLLLEINQFQKFVAGWLQTNEMLSLIRNNTI